MPIVWRDALSVDRGVIDEDHRHLIDLMNLVESILTEDRTLGDLRKALDRLEVYTCRHFAREEKIMISRHYAKVVDHKALHIGLVEELDDAAKPARGEGESGARVSQVLGEDDIAKLIGLLKHWLIDHIVKEDLRLKAFLA